MKQILRKTFLVLAAGVLSSAAWADGEIAFTAGNTIGAEDNSTGWYGKASEVVAIGPHQRLTLKFKTYTATDAQLGSAVWNDQMTHALNIWDGQDQNLFMKGCGWGWKTHKDGGIEDPVDYDVNTSGVFNQKTYGWAADYRTMIGTGADVVMYIERNGSELSISQTFTTSANVKYYHYFSGIFGKTDGDVWLQMTVENAHVDITADKELTDASIKGTLISIQNNTGGFKAGTNKDITIGKDGTAELNFKSFTNKINPFNGWGIEMQYGESFFNLTPGNKNMWGDLNQSPSTDWGTWPAEENDRKEAMDGATVKLTIARSGANVNVTAKHVTAAGVTHTITHSFTPTADGFATSDVTFRFFVEGGHLDLLSTNQEVYATIAGVGDKIAVIGTPAVVKDARVASDEIPSKFTNKAGRLSKAYEVLNDSYEIFAVADYQFTDASKANIKVGNYVTIDGNGMYVAVASTASAPKFAGENGATNGFIGKVHSIAYDNIGLTTIVRIQCIQNVQI